MKSEVIKLMINEKYFNGHKKFRTNDKVGFDGGIKLP